jgi:hypothetical protein
VEATGVIIAVINHTAGLISDAEVQHTIRAVNRQINEDFRPHWGYGATLRLEGSTLPANARIPSAMDDLGARGDAVIYLWDPIDTREALGFHALHHLGVPYGFVFPQVSFMLNEHWSASLSHEALEMLADPEVNRLVMGPHPSNPGQMVYYWYEVCDAVQTETYDIDGVEVCNFLLPLYFTSNEEPGGRNDFLNLPVDNYPLRSFGVHPGGYVGYYDPFQRRHHVYSIRDDRVAIHRMEIKQQLDLTRRSQRYQFWSSSGRPVNAALRSIRDFGA